MDQRRAAWLAERRRAVAAMYDAEAPTYDHEADYPTTLQPLFVGRLVDACPPNGRILDAPCGTGRYFALVTETGRRVVGIDQSRGMLAVAKRRGLAEAIEQVGLQEMTFEAAFDAAMTIDAMENIPPEDWPLVLANLRRATRPGGHIYITVEETDEAAIEAAFIQARARRWPAVRGEVIDGDTAGYHYYPGRGRVLGWLEAGGFQIVDEAYDQQDGWGYRHFLLRR